MTGLIASIVEAYGELRVNKGRILLSLIGVAFSVFALTAVLGGGGMLQGALEQSIERSQGRPSVVSVQVMESKPDATQAELDTAVLDELDRLGITQRSREYQTSLPLQTGHGVVDFVSQGVDPAWGPMHRVEVLAGRWIADSDQDRLAPAIVVNEQGYEALGRPALDSQPVTVIRSDGSTVRAVVIGIVPDESGQVFDQPCAFFSAGAMPVFSVQESEYRATASYLAWVPPEAKDDAMEALRSHLAHTPVGTFDAYDNTFSTDDMGFGIVRNAILAIAVVILLLGALGLVNIALVTIRYRVREIGIRRSYGATGLRIFIGVLMESVVATVIAGAIGVTLAVALVKAPFVVRFFHDNGLVDLPPFPVTAVVTGLLASTVVGVLAGALPALIATRIKVIDAIRS